MSWFSVSLGLGPVLTQPEAARVVTLSRFLAGKTRASGVPRDLILLPGTGRSEARIPGRNRATLPVMIRNRATQ